MTKPAGIPTNGVNMILSTMIKAIMIPKLLDLISIFIRLPINPLIKSFTVIFSHLKIQSLFTMIHKFITISSPKLNLFFPSLYSIPHLQEDVTNHRSEEHTSELQSRFDLVCRLLLEKKIKKKSRI